MDEYPREEKNSQENAVAGKGRIGFWWILSLFAFVGFNGIAILVRGLIMKGLLGLFYLFPLGYVIFAGSLACTAFAVISFIKHEKGRWWALPVAVLCGLYALAPFLQIPIRQNHINQESHKKVALQQTIQQYREQIRKDPQIALMEKWDSKDNLQRMCVFMESFSDTEVHYSMPILQDIYDKSPLMRRYLFISTACTSEFLSAHFQEAYDNCNYDSSMLSAIVSNPNTPLELVERVAKAQHLAGGVIQNARRAYFKRSYYADKNNRILGK